MTAQFEESHMRNVDRELDDREVAIAHEIRKQVQQIIAKMLLKVSKEKPGVDSGAVLAGLLMAAIEFAYAAVDTDEAPTELRRQLDGLLECYEPAEGAFTSIH
jgi:hypothetical protein